jgi:hypothetical protein
MGCGILKNKIDTNQRLQQGMARIEKSFDVQRQDCWTVSRSAVCHSDLCSVFDLPVDPSTTHP